MSLELDHVEWENNVALVDPLTRAEEDEWWDKFCALPIDNISDWAHQSICASFDPNEHDLQELYDASHEYVLWVESL